MESERKRKGLRKTNQRWEIPIGIRSARIRRAENRILRHVGELEARWRRGSALEEPYLGKRQPREKKEGRGAVKHRPARSYENFASRRIARDEGKVREKSGFDAKSVLEPRKDHTI